MQINIIGCEGQHPPIIIAREDTCVEAGDTLVMNIKAYDPDGDNVELSGTGGPFELAQSPALLDPNPASGPDTVTCTLTWPTVCNHVQKQPYFTYFKARDDGVPVNLVALKTITIKVIGPAQHKFQSAIRGDFPVDSLREDIFGGIRFIFYFPHPGSFQGF